jgi:tetratricopeptide (TPR) repeat protein
MALSAREKDSSISPEEVYKLADAILKPRDLNYASHSDAYLLLCCGKLALANQDYTRALQFLDMADRAYPKGCFYYRRVEVQLSRSEALEATGDLWGAFGAAESAMIAATNQLATDSSSSLWSGLARQAKERRAQMESLNFANIRLPEL